MIITQIGSDTNIHKEVNGPITLKVDGNEYTLNPTEDGGIEITTNDGRLSLMPGCSNVGKISTKK